MQSWTKWGYLFDVAKKEEKIAELEYKMGEPDFWDDTEKAQKINQELNDVKIGVDKYKSIVTKADDLEALYELAVESPEDVSEDDVKEELGAVKEALRSRESASSL